MVAFITGEPIRTGFDPVVREFEIDDNSAATDFGNVMAELWHLSVTAFDSGQTTLFYGETDVNIQPGIMNEVHLHPHPLSGGLIANPK